MYWVAGAGSAATAATLPFSEIPVPGAPVSPLIPGFR